MHRWTDVRNGRNFGIPWAASIPQYHDTLLWRAHMGAGPTFFFEIVKSGNINRLTIEIAPLNSESKIIHNDIRFLPRIYKKLFVHLVWYCRIGVKDAVAVTIRAH